MKQHYKYERYDADTKKKVLDLRSQGLKYKEICTALLVGYDFVQRTCQDNGLGGTLAQAVQDQVRSYKAQGHTMAETAEHFGISRPTAQKYCKGIASQCHTEKWRVTVAEKTRQHFAESRDERGIAFVEKYAPNFEYVSGYTGKDATLTVRCKTCGVDQLLSGNVLRHCKVSCKVCKQIERDRLNAEREADRKRKNEEAHMKRIEREAERERKAAERWHECPVCGERTNRKKYCSDKCARRSHNAMRYNMRRLKVKEALVDNDITLDALYKRDGGVCYLCGTICRYDDFVICEGTKITGDWYPSIDHVVPLSKGGAHAWTNVRLAHRRCNYLKSDNAPLS